MEVRRHSHRGATPRFRTAQGDLGQLGILDEASVRVKIPLPSTETDYARWYNQYWRVGMGALQVPSLKSFLQDEVGLE